MHGPGAVVLALVGASGSGGCNGTRRNCGITNAGEGVGKSTNGTSSTVGDVGAETLPPNDMRWAQPAVGVHGLVGIISRNEVSGTWTSMLNLLIRAECGTAGNRSITSPMLISSLLPAFQDEGSLKILSARMSQLLCSLSRHRRNKKKRQEERRRRKK
ncbi:hypothetical protein FB45DRAFT_355253 [Roridomyces roridus]|uniref:Uncharacterized protein n=1 Tax=Roridomyces roridus TaxID=1738132 RepID=A0AAD7FWI0_9AGAR|nr:hypothetical protein FB45DRAFT_355253 [Roridomyces roridus]